MVRLSLENGWHLHTFYKVILGYQKPIWNRDIDKYPHIDLIECLSHASGMSVNKITDMSLQCYYGILFHGNPSAANLRWILPVGIYHRRRRRPGQQFCPLCLKEYRCSYYRKYWRLAFYTVCHKHRCLLLDVCPECVNPLEFNRLGIGSKHEKIPQIDIGLCHKCGFELCQSPTEGIHHLSSEITNPYMGMLSQFITGDEQNTDKGIAIPLSYYEGLRYLVKMILHPYSSEFRSFYLHRFTNLEELKVEKGSAYEYQSANTRRHVAMMACWLVDNWPENFDYVCRLNLLFRSAISDNISHLPYWVGSVLQKYLPNKIYTLSDVELSEAITYLEKQHNVPSASSLARLLGIGKDSAANYLSMIGQRN
jgi:hypothetical protein